MRAGELIEKLKELDPDEEVWVRNTDGLLDGASEIIKKKVDDFEYDDLLNICYITKDVWELK